MSRPRQKKRALPPSKTAAHHARVEKRGPIAVGTTLAEAWLKLVTPSLVESPTVLTGTFYEAELEQTTSRKERTMPEESNTVDILALHQRVRTRERNERIGSAAAGLILSGAAALSGRGKKSLTRVLLATAGGLLIARGVSGLSVKQLSAYVSKLFTHRSDLEKRFNDGEHDIVDAASFDSFPASDPPSYSPGIS
jgi:hypothetical protein